MHNKATQSGVILVVFVATLTAFGCSDNSVSATKPKARPVTAAENDPRAKVLGVEHVGTATETPGTTSPAKSDITKAQQENAMPLPGQANDHSTLSPKATQKAVPATR